MKLRTRPCKRETLGTSLLCMAVTACAADAASTDPNLDAALTSAAHSSDAAASTGQIGTAVQDAGGALSSAPPVSRPDSAVTASNGGATSSSPDSSAGQVTEDGGPIGSGDAGQNATCTNGCLIDGECYAAGTFNPDNPCGHCDPSEDAVGWSARAEGAACDDAVTCNGADTCQAGACVHSGSPCGQNELCQEDVATEQFECSCASGWTGPTCQRCLLYVAPDGNDANAGSSWSEALGSVTTALNAAADGGCEVWVAAGTYRPTPTPNGDPHYASFQLVTGVDLYGGFAGSEAYLEERDIAANETILSGDLAADDDAQEPDTLLENSYRVVTGADNARIDGFTITAGHGMPYQSGAGVYINQTSPTIENCKIIGNSAYEGGGMYISEGSPLVVNCVFEDNHSGVYGGGAIVYGSYELTTGPTFTECTFTGNTAYRGAGLALVGAFGIVTDSAFSENTATSRGGAIMGVDSEYQVSACSFTSNLAADGGGAIDDNSGSVELENCSFAQNSGGIFGGAVAADETTLSLRGSNFSANTGLFGGALYTSATVATIVGSSFQSNTAGNGSGGAISVAAGGQTTVTASSLIGNIAGSGGGVHLNQSDLVLVDTTLSENQGGGVAAEASSSVAAYGCTLDGNSGSSGGALSINLSTLLLEGSVVYANTSTWHGGALQLVGSPSTLISSSTLAGNAATVSGGAIANDSSTLVITNSIVWNNSAVQSYPGIFGTATITYSDVQDWCIENENCSSGNRNLDPLFTDPESGLYNLQSSSPLIDVGNNLAIEADAADLDADEDVAEQVPFDRAGNPRISGSVVDMGAYEFTP